MSRIKLVVIAAVVPLVSLISACNLGQTSGTLGQLQRLAMSCPNGQQVATFVANDVSENDRSVPLIQERLGEIKVAATFTAVCGGVLQVNAFSASDAGTQTLFSGPLQPSGATLNARLLKVPTMVSGVLTTITTALPTATANLPAYATDVVSEFGLMSEFGHQHAAGNRLYGLILTSGLQTTGAVVTNVGLSQDGASDLGERVPVPSLPGAVITIAGLGRVASGPPAPSGYVQALETFFNEACTRTTAVCTVSINPVTSIEGS